MRIPPFYNDKSWQRLFAGFILGLLFGWMFFLYHFGHIHEKVMMDNRELTSLVKNQEKRIDSLEEDKEEYLYESIKNIDILFTNENEVNISELTLYDLKNEIENTLESID